mmetsp:Transcript_27691/g.52156  ORF Transcript_27691/g.52156 Transcript_27691/m.52156 type:complete len:720 (+) Transcript_27691:462-2621(+)|eukprot:CAMPEP_0201667700 /NCGR_PEP_ID=MMETSP0494-20130426/16301_1 /ASSEMBLY_ACC=CAM_ASM_000839 /TAXON_ID=420259 /ORGANISM="Thalassiosira gravida, Strain GMp14c1" /LENGTH=719 /DNA_ID=CAMNT_0048147797 /DNA_START=427 /DNA_END=2586 /DNA_ORIENTATION=-
MLLSQAWTQVTLGASFAVSSGVGIKSIADALVLPSPLTSSHSILLHPDARRGRWHSVAAPVHTIGLAKQRSGYVFLNGPLNVMSMDHQAGITGSVPEPINVTMVADPTSSDVLDWVNAAEVAAHVDGGSYEANAASEFNFLSREMPVIEENVVVVESPDELASQAPKQDHPSILKIIQFSLPAIGVWLCSPVLSMIDTASVGLLAGTAQQAALNPAVSVTDYGALLVAFMYTATTNLVAGAVEIDSSDVAGGGDQPRTRRTLVTALRLALLVGVAFGAVLGCAAPTLLRMLIGNSSLDPTVYQSALRYVQIRSLGMPAAVVIGTAQSACLGMKDVKSPLYVLAAAAGINLLGDMLMVRNASPWLGGAAGAAWATVFSQYGALLMFLRWLTVKSKKLCDTDSLDGHVMEPMEIIKDTSKDVRKNIKVTFGNAYERGTVLRKKLFSSNQPNVVEVTKSKRNKDALAKGFLSGTHKPFSVLNPTRLTRSKSTIKKFLPFVVPVTTTSIGRVSGFVTMSHVASSALGTFDMAAHQIAISIFCCLAPVVDALNQVAQSFVPGIFAREKGRARAVALRKTSINFAKVGALFGSVIVALVATCVPALSKCFTTDPIVLSRVKNAIPGIAVFLGFDGLMCIGEGTLLGQNDLKFLRNMYAAFFFLVPSFMLRLKRRALNGIDVGIGALWGTFSVYEVVRTVLWLGRVVWLQHRTEREVDEMEAAAAT